MKTLQAKHLCICEGTGMTAKGSKQDLSFDLRKRIQLTQTQICPPGRPTCRCLEMRLQVYGAPTSGTMFYSADYYHSGSSAEH